MPETLSVGQAVLRILGIIAVFGTVVYFKTQPDLGGEMKKFITRLKPVFQTTRPENQPRDTDFKVVHTVNVPFANVRARPTTQSSVITVLERGQQVRVLNKGDRWTQIELNGKTGWIATHLLDSRIE